MARQTKEAWRVSALNGGEKAMRHEDEDIRPAGLAAKPGHIVGEPLDRLSVEELALRIEALQAEILRLERARDGKTASKAAADAFFKK
jgi:uncharacterized small protein (DUF1192 family)